MGLKTAHIYLTVSLNQESRENLGRCPIRVPTGLHEALVELLSYHA